METYCGKNCDDCTYKEELSCPGCLSGPGRMISGDCKVAGCCREKGHETCENCELKRNCGKWLDKGNIPSQRIERRQEEKEKQALIERRAPFLGKWLWFLFWITIAYQVLNFMSGDTVKILSLSLGMPGLVGSYMCQIASVYILFVISKEHSFYKNAAILNGVCMVINILSVFITEEQIFLPLLAAVIQIVVVLTADYYEYKANADVVLATDGRTSEQWDNFWNWNIYSYIGLAAGIVLLFLIPALGSLTAFVSSVGLIVARIKKIVCLYRSAQVFRMLENKMKG